MALKIIVFSLHELTQSNLDYTREIISQGYELIASIAQFNKPLVAEMNGVTNGIGLGFLFGSHASYSTNMKLMLNEIGSSVIGGLTYHLLRAPKSLALYSCMCQQSFNEVEAL